MKIKSIKKVTGPLEIRDPYILVSSIYNRYPEGNENMEPKKYLPGRNIGADFDRSQPWRMYHGERIPGFPQHPHKGFEIVTIIPEGFADHFDSKGSTGRYGDGDVQLMSVGNGVMHSEMFPLLNSDKENPFRLFQIWLNLPAKGKNTAPDYKMMWSEKIPEVEVESASGNKVKVKVILGEYNNVKSLGSLEHSWAADPKNNVGIALIDMQPNTEYILKATSETMNRFLLHYEGEGVVKVEDKDLEHNAYADLNGGEAIVIKTTEKAAKLLLLEGEPINEPVAAYGPFVMNTETELQQAFQDYQKTKFGGWKWGDNEKDIVHPKETGRFASYNYGEVTEKPEDVN